MQDRGRQPWDEQLDSKCVCPKDVHHHLDPQDPIPHPLLPRVLEA